MAPAAKIARLSARLASRYVNSHTTKRAFTASSQNLIASNFTMPALSPTMTEGNIAQWQVKEGDSFTAGDVLLEIETDKATMDVEAQDDGILVKITAPNESKGVKVGQRIGIMAEAGDDISSLELPKEDTVENKTSEKQKPPAEDSQAQSKSSSAESSRAETTQEQDSKPQTENRKSSSPPKKQTYPLYPSVQHLLHTNGLSDADADKITATGPNGRLLKGDVLAYLGQISKDYPTEASARLDKLSHLDLSNIQPAPSKSPTAEASKDKPVPTEPELPKETEVALPISLSAVLVTQKRIHTALNTTLPLSTFIARASDLANEDLPLSKRSKPSSTQLFNAVLGLPSSATISSRGHFVPQVTPLGPADVPLSPSRRRKADIIDILTAKPRARQNVLQSSVRPGAAAVANAVGENVFSVTARQGEERRAMVYLEKMKTVLEQDPGRLVL